MGLNDREYYRGDQPGLRLAMPTTAVGLLILINVAVAVVDIFFMNGELKNLLAAKATMLQRPWLVWQLLTAGFAHDGFWHLLGNMLMLWFFGTRVEQRYGKAEFMRLYLGLVVLANLVFVIWQNIEVATTGVQIDKLPGVVGASGAVTGIFTLFVIHWPHEKVYIWGVFPIPAWVLGLVYLGSNLQMMQQDLGGGGDDVRIAWQVHLAGAGLAYLYYLSKRRLGDVLPKRWTWNTLTKKFKPRPKLRLHEPRERENSRELHVDQILAKINEQGMDSLTAAERRTLEDESRRARQRRS